jgi:hypothetical protein
MPAFRDELVDDDFEVEHSGVGRLFERSLATLSAAPSPSLSPKKTCAKPYPRR